MSAVDPKIKELESRLDRLIRTQIDFQTEISSIRIEIARLRFSNDETRPMETVRRPEAPQLPERWTTAPLPPPITPETSKLPPQKPSDEEVTKPLTPSGETGQNPDSGQRTDFGTQPLGTSTGAAEKGSLSGSWTASKAAARSDLEKFIGENLISKIGIVVLVLGVGIGAKFAIDNNLISPLTRIIIGYVFGLTLVGFAIRLKAKYLNFSAVLLSGGMAILYFVTYFAYALYALIVQPSAFGLMVLFTIITVAAALYYDRHIIAHIGLVGAYAVPFLLSNNSGNYLFLFIYMAVVNGGILAISVAKYWRSLFYTSSVFTWLIFASWLATKYVAAEHFYLALTFLGVFFAIFYLTKIIHGIVQPASTDAENIICLIITSLVFYAHCFAISDVSASVFDYAVLFSYLGAISLAILLTSYRFYGRILVYVAFPLTWLIYAVWFGLRYKQEEHFLLAAAFAGVFFLIFYGATLIYRLATDDIGMIENTGLVLTNSFVFYGFGYAIIDSRETLRGFEGVYTVGHAAFHSLVSQAVSRLKPSAIDVAQVLVILILTFATIAIPVQFDGSFVTLIWVVEAALLFAFGRMRQIPLFEYFSYPLMVLAAGSQALDWIGVYSERAAGSSELAARPFANGDMITGLVFVAAFGFIYFANADSDKESVLDDALIKPFAYLTATVALIALYNTFRMEIGNFFHLQAVSVGSFVTGTPDLFRFNAVAQIDYTMLFLIVMGAVNLQKVRSLIAAYANIALSILTILIFLTAGMYLLFELRESYLGGSAFGLFGSPTANVLVRYFSYAFLAGTIAAIFAYRRSETVTNDVDDDVLIVGFDAILYPSLLIVLSCEVMNISAQLHVFNAEKYGLSILWGIYSLALIAIGIAKSRKYLRIAGMGLMAVTLMKLFFVDITDLGTIPKTILFVSLGLLLLVVSFLYNKYKVFIFGPEKPEDEDEN